MNKRDYYYFREILLGLKNEYLRYNIELQKLKNYARANNEKIVDYNFWIHKWIDDKKPELKCTIEAKKNRIEQLIESIEKKLGIYSYPYSYECRFNNNGEAILGDHGLYVLGTSPEFYSQAQLILNSEFANDLFLERIISIDNNCASIYVNPMYIRCAYSKSQSNYTSFMYQPTQFNKVYVNAKSITEEELYGILDSKYSREWFSTYHQKTIDSSLSTTKPIEIHELPNKISKLSYETMELEELDSKAVLQKIKKR